MSKKNILSKKEFCDKYLEFVAISKENESESDAVYKEVSKGMKVLFEHSEIGAHGYEEFVEYSMYEYDSEESARELYEEIEKAVQLRKKVSNLTEQLKKL